MSETFEQLSSKLGLTYLNGSINGKLSEQYCEVVIVDFSPLACFSKVKLWKRLLYNRHCHAVRCTGCLLSKLEVVESCMLMTFLIPESQGSHKFQYAGKIKGSPWWIIKSQLCTLTLTLGQFGRPNFVAIQWLDSSSVLFCIRWLARRCDEPPRLFS